MTDRERLVQLMKDGYELVPVGGFVYDGIAKHLRNKGVIVPPCQVGDTVYCIGYGVVEELKVKKVSIEIDEDLCSRYINAYRHNGQCETFSFEDFGKDVFCTHEEAKNALVKKE